MNFNQAEKLKPTTGFSLAELIISIGLISILILAIFSLTQYVLKLAAENKFRLGAIMVADRKIEKIKNLPYDQIGTAAGIIHGSILDNELVATNNGIFNVNTLVQYIDDPFDGVLSGSPNDILPTDYKQITIKVRWFGKFGQKEITVFTKISPRGLETNGGGGVLSITVFNASGQPVNLADVHIANKLLIPLIDFDAVTNAGGRLDFPGAPQSIEGYEITVSKSGYSTSSTTARTIANPNPTQPNATVLAGQITITSYTIDLLSSLTIKTVHQALPENWVINTDGSSENQTFSNLAADSAGNLYFVWQDYRSASDSKIYWQKYNVDGDVQWPDADIRISSANNQVLPDIKISTSSNYAYIAWSDNSSGNQDGFLEKRSLSDGSLVWSGSKKIDTSANSADQTNVRLALYNRGLEIITAVWQDNRDGNLDIYLQSYDENKNQLWANEVKVNRNTDNSDQFEPAIILDSQNNIYVVWTDKRDGGQNIYAAKYNSAGQAVWESDIKINSSSGSSVRYSPVIAIDKNDFVYFAWADERNGSSDIYLAKYDSAGQAVWTSADIIATAYSAYNQKSPSLAINSDNNLFLSWTDERNGNQDIYAQKLDANGNRLWTEDLRVNINLGASNQSNSEIIINPLNNQAYVAWDDNRSENFDILASQIDFYGATTTVANVPLTITGAKQIGDNPIIFKYLKNYSTNSSGELILANIEWDSYNISLSAGYSANQIIMTAPELPLNLTPAAASEIILYLAN